VPWLRVRGLRILARCRCGDDFCASFYTATAPRPDGAFGPDLRTIGLSPHLIVDAIGPDIMQVEVLYRDDLRARIHAAVP